MGKKKHKKGIESLDKRIEEHREKQAKTTNPDLFHYWEREIEKLEREKKKKEEKL